MGSKQAIVEKFIDIFPKADNFYDLFGGGFSVTQCMLEKRGNDYKKFHFNEINPLVVDLIKKAINSEYNYDKFKPEFITREKFFELKDRDGYVKYIWSFGNLGRTYLFGKNIEKYKQSMHNAVVFGEFDELATEVFQGKRDWLTNDIKERRLVLRRLLEFYRKNGIPKILYQFLNEKQLEQLQQLERLQQLQQLQQLQRLQQLTLTSLDYRKVNIEPNSVIYCDIPYKGTAKYSNNNFNHKEFFDWANNQSNPVFISEYNINDSRFYLIREIKKKALLNHCTNTKQHVIEKIYCNKAAWDILNKK